MVRSVAKPTGLGLRLTRPFGSRPKAGSCKEVCWAIEPDFMDRSHLNYIRLNGLVFGDDPDLFVCSAYLFWIVYLILSQGVELRMVLVKPRSGEGSVSERLCNVWLDDARDELVIVYETVKKLCIGSHVSKLEKENRERSERVRERLVNLVEGLRTELVCPSYQPIRLRLTPEVVSDPYGSVYDLLSQDMVHGLSKPGKSRMVRSVAKPTGLGLRLTQPFGSRPKAGSGKEVCWAIEPDFMDRSHLNSIWLDGLVFGDDPDLFVCSAYLFWTVYLILSQGVELRMVLVKPRSREGSVSERLCNVWLDDARDELVIVYETFKKLCIGSHVSK
ncbi:hypothetical protein Bca4012_050278 [Brassica carinata]